MKKIFFLAILFTFSASLCHAESDLDGEWKLRYNVCVSLSGQELFCEKSSYDITISDSEFFYNGERMGGVTENEEDNKVTFTFDNDYLNSLMDEKFQSYGLDLSKVDAELNLYGKLKDDKIRGKAEGKVTWNANGVDSKADISGKFKTKRK
ncbi:MAG: hypothetical protein FJ264_08320 [Planctomycetes bacterium]|nr:hypothetical protein [Planctomycetota bacterium]